MDVLKQELLTIENFDEIVQKMMSTEIIHLAKNYLESLHATMVLKPKDFLTAFMIYKFPVDTVGNYNVPENKQLIDTSRLLINSHQSEIKKNIVRYSIHFKTWKNKDLKTMKEELFNEYHQLSVDIANTDDNDKKHVFETTKNEIVKVAKNIGGEDFVNEIKSFAPVLINQEQLENQYRAILLEKARTEDPWKLITKPTLLPEPVAPKKVLIILISLFSGLIAGIISSFLKEKRKNIIFSSKGILGNSENRKISQWKINDLECFNESIQLIKLGSLSKVQSNIALIPVGDIENNVSKKICKSLNSIYKNGDIILAEKFLNASEIKNIILLIGLGITKKEELNEITNLIDTYNKNEIELLIFNDLESKQNYDTSKVIDNYIVKSINIFNDLRKEFNRDRIKYAFKKLKKKISYYIQLFKNN